jgi:hypothetical protein
MRFIPLTLAIGLAAVCGCERPLPPETDPAQGRAALKAVLNTWVKGGRPEDLKRAGPAIIAYDPDWEAGRRLTKYEIDPKDRRMGVDLLLKVTLSLGGPGAKTADMQVNFTVAIGKETVVLRQQ